MTWLQYVGPACLSVALVACAQKANESGSNDGGGDGGSGDGSADDGAPDDGGDDDGGTGGGTGGSSDGPGSSGTDSGNPTSGGTDSPTGDAGTTTEPCEIEIPQPGTCPSPSKPTRPRSQAPGVGPEIAAQLGRGPRIESGLPFVAPDPDPKLGPGSFIQEPDFGVGPSQCDVYTQDCASGEKCMPWANDGGSTWNATKCSPLSPNPDDIGDPCTVEGNGVSGVDSCKRGAMCWDVDPATNEGHCLELCHCSAANPICDTPGTTCSITNDGVLPLCLPVCNPLNPDCEGGEICAPVAGYFNCVLDASGGAGAGDACEFVNACSAGLFCANATGVPGCAGSVGCCAEFCNVDDPNACAGIGGGVECVPWYDSMAPKCFESLGACMLPP